MMLERRAPVHLPGQDEDISTQGIKQWEPFSVSALQDVLRRKDGSGDLCGECKGSGRCQACHGAGETSRVTFKLLFIEVREDVRCGHCSGSGKCPRCSGTGGTGGGGQPR